MGRERLSLFTFWGRGEVGEGGPLLVTSIFPLLLPSSSPGVAKVIYIFDTFCTPGLRHRGSSSYVSNPCTGFPNISVKSFCSKAAVQARSAQNFEILNGTPQLFFEFWCMCGEIDKIELDKPLFSNFRHLLSQNI